jgi:hypothetical protein
METVDIVKFIGLVVANGIAVVPLLNKIPAWVELPGNVKGIAVFVFLLFLPVFGDLTLQALQSLSPEVLAQINHYFFLIQTGFFTWAGSQYGYELYQVLRLKTGEVK